MSLFRPAILAALAAALLNFAHAAETPPKSHLARFESEGELRDWLASLKKRLLTEQQAARAQTRVEQHHVRRHARRHAQAPLGAVRHVHDLAFTS